MAHAAWRSTLAAAVLGLSAVAAHAEVVRIVFHGTLSSMGIYDYFVSEYTPLSSSNFLGPMFKIGDGFNGIIDLDTDMARTDLLNGGHTAWYETMGSKTQLRIWKDTYNFYYQSEPKYHTWEGGSVGVFDSMLGNDADEVYYNSHGSFDTGFSNFVDVHLHDSSGNALSDAHIPTEFNSQLFPNSRFSSTWMPNSGNQEFTWTVDFTSISSFVIPPPPPPVPEPSSWMALAAGLGFIGLRRKASARVIG